MRLATKKALLKSIKHWRENEQVKNLSDVKLGRHNCALCERFGIACRRYTAKGKVLEHCPVFERTGRAGCINTPYNNCCSASTITAFRAAATLEREFLESLLPTETTESTL